MSENMEQGVKKKGSSVDLERIAALAVFRHEVIRYLNFSKAAAETEDITAQQYQAMLFIKGLADEGGKMALGDLAEKLFTTHHSTVELVDRMEKAGLVSRHTEEWDRRRVSVELTVAGQHKLERLVEHHLRELSHSDLAKKLQKLSQANI